MKPLRRDDFPVLNTYTYLNTPASGLLSESLMEFRQNHDIDFLIGGSLFRDRHKTLIEKVRKTVATFFGAEKENTVLSPNFTIGYQNLMTHLPTAATFVGLEGDYPNLSMVPSQFKKQFYSISAGAGFEDRLYDYIAKNKPYAFVFGLAQYTDGRVMEEAFLKQLKSDFPDFLLLADGTQYLGTRPFHFGSSPIDAIGCSGYKWLLAGYGNGFWMLKEDFKKSCFNNQQAFIEAFELGHQDTFNYSGLQFALEYLKNLGVNSVYEQIRALSVQAKEILFRAGLIPEEVAINPNHLAIFNIQGAEKQVEMLKNKGVIVSYRGNGIRLGLHFYNEAKDLKIFTQEFKKIKK